MTEQRREQRSRTLRGGKIVFNDRRSVIDCLVRNLSDGGTCLQVNSTIDVPFTFDLKLDGEQESRPCKVVWVTDNRMGVEFQDGRDNEANATEALSANTGPDKGYVRADLITLWAALDRVPIGIVLLDGDNRAQFINRAFRKMWRLPDVKADCKPPFVALMYHGRDTRAYAIPSGDVDAYIAARVDHVRRGDSKPVDLRLTSGEVIRMQCTVLPNDARMLCYTYVTDIVSNSDELEQLRAALDNIQQGIILLDPMLNATFMNRAVRKLWNVSDQQADRHPSYVELVTDSRRTGTYGVAPGELNKFIANRVAIARAGDPTPIDIPHSDGRTIRSQCAVLPGGGRMLTYTDVSDLVERAAQLEELATIDALCGVYNRRQFNSLAGSEWNRFQRYHRPLSVIVLDIDHFKQINDRHGHSVGDRAISHVAALCKEERRSTDVVARLGGDEFVILLPETTLARARAVAERLRERILRQPLRLPDGGQPAIALDVSIGVAEATISMSGYGALLSLGDQALYRAKEAGRGCIAISEPMEAMVSRAAAE